MTPATVQCLTQAEKRDAFSQPRSHYDVYPLSFGFADNDDVRISLAVRCNVNASRNYLTESSEQLSIGPTS